MAKARRTAMAAQRITFEKLIEIMREKAGAPDMPSKSIFANCKSALKAFAKERGFRLTDRVGSLLRSGFARACAAHRVQLEADHRDDRYIVNRFTYLRPWHDLVRTIDHDWAIGEGKASPLQDALKDLFVPAPDGGGFQVKPTARKSGVPLPTLRRWLNGGVPRVDVVHYLARIEKACELDEGYLVDLLPRYLREQAQKKPPVTRSPFSERLSRLTTDHYRIGTRGLPAPEAVRTEWLSLLESKAEKAAVLRSALVGPVISDGSPAGDNPKIEASDGHNMFLAAMDVSDESLDKQWRANPLEHHTTRKAHAWAVILNGLHYPSAESAWSQVSTFLGWAHLPTHRGGLGLPISALTLGLLMDHGTVEQPGRLLQFLNWRVKRSEGINHGTVSFVRVVQMLCHPDTGFLQRHPEIGAKVGFSDENHWISHCKRVHADLSLTKRKLSRHARVSRDPVEPIRTTLELEYPLSAFHTMLKRLHRANPDSGGLLEAEWARDCALVALAMSNPLRARNFRQLTWRPDNSGELRRVNDEWRIYIPKEKFKNIHGAAHDHDYDQAVDEWAWSYIERYIKHHRAQFGTSTDLVFVSSDRPNETWANLSKTFRKRCRQFLDDSPGSGIHSIRHIVATHTILVTNGDYLKAAMYLHDQPETVRKHYAHLLAVVADRARRKVNNLFMKTSQVDRQTSWVESTAA